MKTNNIAKVKELITKRENRVELVISLNKMLSTVVVEGSANQGLFKCMPYGKTLYVEVPQDLLTKFINDAKKQFDKEIKDIDSELEKL